MSDPWIDAARVDTIDEVHPLAVELNGIAVALMRRGDRVVAVRDRCPHMNFPLSEGFVVDGQIECALHHWRFDVFDPAADDVPPEARCRFFEVEIRDGHVFVRVDA